MLALGNVAARAADPALEAPPPAPQTGGNWTFSVAPYFWMAGLNGDVGLFGRQPVSVDQKFQDILDDLDFAGMVVAEMHNGEWGLFADIIYVKTGADEAITRYIREVPVSLEAEVDTTSFTATVMGEYRVLSDSRYSVDLMGGARVWSVNNDISARLAAGNTPVAEFSGSDGATWVDPMIGARGKFALTDSWYLAGWGMVGGFGAGSDVTWDVLGAVEYRWSDSVSLAAGYRALGVDYDDDGFIYDIVQHGPILGAVFRF